MSFTDMMSSGRGPGAIGVVMALFVMIGFGLLFVFVFDEGMQGGDRTIESYIAEQRREIEKREQLIRIGEEELAAAGGRAGIQAELDRTKLEIRPLRSRALALATEIEESEAALKAGEEAFVQYRDDYRTHVREQAKGREMDELKTADGTVYHEVSIREVTAIGMQIRHRDGHKRIPYADLPQDMIDHFQFDDEQRATALRREQEMHRRHEQAVAAATAADTPGTAELRHRRSRDSPEGTPACRLAGRDLRLAGRDQPRQESRGLGQGRGTEPRQPRGALADAARSKETPGRRRPAIAGKTPEFPLTECSFRTTIGVRSALLRLWPWWCSPVSGFHCSWTAASSFRAAPTGRKRTSERTRNGWKSLKYGIWPVPKNWNPWKIRAITNSIGNLSKARRNSARRYRD